MKFESYADRGVDAAVELINRLSPGWSQGRLWSLPSGSAERRELARQVEAKIADRPVALSGRAGEELIQLARDLRSVVELMSQARPNEAAELVNQLLIRYQAAPQLARHDGEAWHLHFHSQAQEAGQAMARGATCVIALAVVIGSPGGTRLGICSAGHCDRAFIDTSKNGSRRFCSPSCLSRTKVAAFRARRAALGASLAAAQPPPLGEIPAVAALDRLRRRGRVRSK
ncbi:MAG TPA: CGNR zinc finger domain-containing protein [Candidatus Dormibacteraeota bacterium]